MVGTGKEPATTIALIIAWPSIYVEISDGMVNKMSLGVLTNILTRKDSSEMKNQHEKPTGTLFPSSHATTQ